VVKNVDLVNGQLLIGGSFSTVGGQSRTALASLNPTTGAVTSYADLAFANPLNGGSRQVLKMAVSPDGNTLVVIGNFTQIEGQGRQFIAKIDLGGSATLSSWATNFYTNTCNKVFDTYMRDLDFAPDSSYFVVSTTGAYGGSNAPCDVITRWETSATGPGQEATWRDYTGGDTTYAVAVTGAAVYIGGHMRWMNNPYAGDAPGPGAVPREGIAALDPVSGLPLSWNPGRARGVGVFDMLATSSGLWVGSDTDRLGGETHRKIGFFPLAGGTTPPTQDLPGLPGSAYLLGQSAGSTDPGVLYRVNAGGPALQSADDGPDWLSDSESAPYRSGASNTSSTASSATPNASVPSSSNDRAPVALFSTERWGSSSGSEMEWHFPVPAGTAVTVRLYLANRYSGTGQVGQRVFDVTLDGATVLNDWDLVQRYGDQVGAMESFDITSDGSVDLGFLHVTENPLVDGIEIVTTGSQTGGGGGSSAADSVRVVPFDGTDAGAPIASAGTAPWGLARGAFLIDNVLYTGAADGSFSRRTFNGSTFGSPTVLPMYDGSFGSDVGNLTGLTYSQGRIYYTMFGDNTLYWRWFSPESDVVGAVRYTVNGSAALNPSRVRGMFLSGTSLYAADRDSGDLVRVSLSGDSVSGSATTVDASTDWRARAMFLSDDGAPPPPPSNDPPVAVAAQTGCVDLTCSFSSAGSHDDDGSIVSYAWTFGDGGTSNQQNPDHTYASAGNRTVTLTVTDNDGATNSATTTATPSVPVPGNEDPVADFSYTCVLLVCDFDGTASSDPEDGNVASWSWVYQGGGGPNTGSTPTHSFASPGNYDVTLTVADSDGATDSVTKQVTVSVPSGSDIAFRGAATDAGNVTGVDVPAPSGMQSGDALLLFVTSNKGLSPTSAPAGWTLVGDQNDGSDLRTTLYQRVAPGGNNLGAIDWPTRTKTNVTVLAYSNAVAVPTAAESAAKTTGSSSSYPAPDASVGSAGSWVVSFWALKVSQTVPSWTAPGGTTARASDAGAGGGLISGFAADQGPVSPGSYAGKTATASANTAKATGWTVVLQPN
jgi:PKD repeat protein